jgi:pilus assembly protein TadC
MSIGLISFFVVLAVLLSFYAIFAPTNTKAKSYPLRPGVTPNSDSLFEKLVRPAIRNLMPQTPLALTEYARSNDGIAALLARTGNPWRVSPEEYIVVRVLSLMAGVMLLTTMVITGYAPIPIYVALPLGLFLGFIAPKALLDSAWGKRRRDLNMTMPEALDMLRICMDAGYNFQNALGQTVELLPDSITKDELGRILAEMRAGRTITQALTSFSRRCPTDIVESFVRSISQAQSTGADIASTLSYQSEEARAEYERAVDVRAQKLQTTLFLPLIGFFLPVLMILIFGPAVTTLGSAL